MHELAVCRALISQVVEIARSRAGRVHTVRVAVGPLAGIEPQLLERAYPLAGAGTAAEGSRLAIETMPLRVRCRRCGADSVPRINLLVCEVCGNWETDLVSGNEMLLQSVDLQVGEEPIEPETEAHHV